jgi:hypothetical protein
LTNQIRSPLQPQHKITAPTAAPLKKEQAIKNGQLAVESSSDKKFTNIKFTSNELIPYLAKKYQCDYIVFVNELDIRTGSSYDVTGDGTMREIMVHYTIVNKDSKLIAAGAATSKVPAKENNPKKIVSAGFSPIASFIAARLSLALNPAKK